MLLQRPDFNVDIYQQIKKSPSITGQFKIVFNL